MFVYLVLKMNNEEEKDFIKKWFYDNIKSFFGCDCKYRWKDYIVLRMLIKKLNFLYCEVKKYNRSVCKC